MRKQPGLIQGSALAARFGFYIGQMGTPCVHYTFAQPTFTAKGSPSGTAYALDPLPLTIMFQFGQDAQDAATALGIVDEQVAVGFAAAKDAARVKDRDFVKDAQNQFWLVRDIPDAQPLGNSPLGVMYVLVRTTKPPAGVI